MEFTCHHCHTESLIKLEWLGMQVRCPVCQKMIRLPKTATQNASSQTTVKMGSSGDDRFSLLPEDDQVTPPANPFPPRNRSIPPVVRVRKTNQTGIIVLACVLGGMVFLGGFLGAAMIIFGGSEQLEQFPQEKADHPSEKPYSPQYAEDAYSPSYESSYEVPQPYSTYSKESYYEIEPTSKSSTYYEKEPASYYYGK